MQPAALLTYRMGYRVRSTVVALVQLVADVQLTTVAVAPFSVTLVVPVNTFP